MGMVEDHGCTYQVVRLFFALVLILVLHFQASVNLSIVQVHSFIGRCTFQHSAGDSDIAAVPMTI